MKADYLRALKLPIVGWIFTYFIVVVSVKAFPALIAFGNVPMGAGFLDVVGLVLGAWAGYKIVEFGGKFVDVLVVTVILSLVAGVLQIVEVGVLVSFPLPVDVAGELPVAVFTVLNVVAGALTAGGFALTK